MKFEHKELSKVDLEKDKLEIDTALVKLNLNEIPSYGKTYPEDAQIYYRTYGYQEIKWLDESEISLYDKHVILINGILTKNMNKEDLTYYDYLYINFLRKISFLKSDEYYFEYNCMCTTKSQKHTFNLANVIDFKTIDVDLPVTVEFDNFTKSFNPMTIGKYLFLLKNNLLTVRIGDTEVFIDDDLAELASMAEGDYEENYKLLNENILSSEEHSLVSTIFDVLDHGLNKYKFKCKKLIELSEEEKEADGKEKYKECGIEHNVEFLGGELLIFPFRKSSGPPRNRIVFGKKRNS